MNARHLTGRIALGIGTLVVSLALAEIVVRVFALAPGFAEVSFGQHRTSADPELIWELDPGSPGVNSSGMRGPELDQPKLRRRLAVLGDSIAFGLCLGEAETIPARMQAEFDARGANIEVMNCGVAGYNTTQEARWLELKGETFDVDEILVLFCVNDVDPLDHLPEGEVRYAAQGTAQDALALVHNTRRASRAVRWLLTHSHLSRLVFDRTSRTQKKTNLADARDLTIVSAAFDRMRAFAMNRGIRIRVAIVPYFTSYANYPYEWIHEHVARLAHDRGFEIEDLLPAARQYDRGVHRKLGLPEDPLHPNADGAKLIAHEVARLWSR